MYRTAIFVHALTTLTIQTKDDGIQLKLFKKPSPSGASSPSVVCVLGPSTTVPVQAGIYMIVSKQAVTVSVPSTDTDTEIQQVEPLDKDPFPRPPTKPKLAAQPLSDDEMLALRRAFPMSRSQ